VRWDGSPHAWLGDRGPTCCLVGARDDAPGQRLPGAAFVPAEDTVSDLQLLRTLVGTCGIPVALYLDRHSIFRRNDEGGTIAEELPGFQEPTQGGRALAARGIAAIYALSPQAKGRIARRGGPLQDRLVAALRLAGITPRAAANAFLPGFTPRFNARFGRPAAARALGPGPRPALQPLPGGHGAQRPHGADPGAGAPDPAGAGRPRRCDGARRGPAVARWGLAPLPPRSAHRPPGPAVGAAGAESPAPARRWPVASPG
jgi:hypothetical protein